MERERERNRKREGELTVMVWSRLKCVVVSGVRHDGGGGGDRVVGFKLGVVDA